MNDQPAPDDIRHHLDRVGGYLRIAESALGKARHSLGGASHAESFSQQARASAERILADLSQQDELRYLVCIDGVPDREDTPYYNAVSALIDARLLKRSHPDSTITLQVIFES